MSGAGAGKPTDRVGGQAVIGRVSRAHGVRGEVSVDIRTDDPGNWFVPGAVLGTEPAAAGPLRIDAVRGHAARLLVTFTGVRDRDAAEALRGVRLLVDVPTDRGTGDPDEFYDSQLVGLAVRTLGGEPLGVVAEVLHLPGHELLSVRTPDGAELLVPFARAVVPTVDLAGGEVVLDPPPGLLPERR